MLWKHRTRMADKLLFAYILLGIIPILLITVVFSRMTSSLISEKSSEMIQFHARQSAEIINNEVQTLYDLIYNCATDKELVKQCRAYAENNNRSYATTQIADAFNNYMNMDSDVISQLFIAVDGDFVLRQRYQHSTWNNVWNDRAYRQDILKKVIGGNQLLTFPSKSRGESQHLSSLFCVAIPIRDYTAKHAYGVLITEVSSRFFDNIYIDTPTEKDGLPEIFLSGYNLVVDDDGSIYIAVQSNDQTDQEPCGEPESRESARGAGD